MTTMATQGPPGGVHRSLDVAALLARKGDHTAIEVKATATVSNVDLKGLRALAEEGRFKRLVQSAPAAARARARWTVAPRRMR